MNKNKIVCSECAIKEFMNGNILRDVNELNDIPLDRSYYRGCSSSGYPQFALNSLPAEELKKECFEIFNFYLKGNNYSKFFCSNSLPKPNKKFRSTVVDESWSDIEEEYDANESHSSWSDISDIEEKFYTSSSDSEEIIIKPMHSIQQEDFTEEELNIVKGLISSNQKEQKIALDKIEKIEKGSTAFVQFREIFMKKYKRIKEKETKNQYSSTELKLLQKICDGTEEEKTNAHKQILATTDGSKNFLDFKKMYIEELLIDFTGREIGLISALLRGTKEECNIAHQNLLLKDTGTPGYIKFRSDYINRTKK